MDTLDFSNIDQLIQKAQERLKELEDERQKVITEIDNLNRQKEHISKKRFAPPKTSNSIVTNAYSQEEKIALFIPQTIQRA
jgi:peptidoglycan hydrolase CwlO-like protein